MTKQAIHAFIDTNVFLSFYAYTNDDIEQLRKLVSLIKTDQLRLYFTKQVEDEFRRNREGKLRESLKEFEKVAGSSGVPRFMESYPAIGDFRRAVEQTLKAKDEAIQQAKREAETNSLAADKLFEAIKSAAGIIKRTKLDLEKAQIRMALGNPPGKEGSLGDAINWEILLRVVPDDAELYIISKDGDFRSALSNAPNRFLTDEWQSKKTGNLFLRDQLKPFLAEHFPKIQLAIDAEKRAAMDKLINSPNFATTHSAISSLVPFLETFTAEDMSELLRAFEANGQVGWIASDPDVKAFYFQVLNRSKLAGTADDEQCSRIMACLEPAKAAEPILEDEIEVE
jgi:predicted nucleic acid-binding protein